MRPRRGLLELLALVLTLALALGVSLSLVFGKGHRLADYRDPSMTYEEGWTTLFNGKDLSGWIPVLEMEDGSTKKYLSTEIGEQSTFFVKDGSIHTTGIPNGYLRTEDVYDNYVFHVEARYKEEGNAGVLVHVQKDKVWPRGVECQGYFAHMMRIFPIRGATLDGGEMIHANSKPPGEWNTWEIYSEEGRLATVLNGAVVGLASNSDPKVGYICLVSEGVDVDYRNIKVKRYTPAHHMRNAP